VIRQYEPGDSKDVVLEIVKRICGSHPRVYEVDTNTDLFETGLLDSFSAIELIVILETTFGVPIAVEELTMENLSSIDNIVKCIHLLKLKQDE